MKLSFDTEVLPDRQTVSLNIGTGNETPVELILSAADLSDLIHVMGEARMALDDGVPLILEDGARIRGLDRPSIHVHAGADGARILCLRDPAFGWTGFELTSVDAAKLANALC